MVGSSGVVAEFCPLVGVVIVTRPSAIEIGVGAQLLMERTAQQVVHRLPWALPTRSHTAISMPLNTPIIETSGRCVKPAGYTR